jgi:hypothetical protein
MVHIRTDGYRGNEIMCIQCCKCHKCYYKRHRLTLNKYARLRRLKNIDHFRKRDAQYRAEHPNRFKLWAKTHRKQESKRHLKWMREHPEMGAYYWMKTRCNNPKTNCWKYYGGRGIKCLIQSGQEIINAIGPRPTSKHSIDRIDVNGNYETQFTAPSGVCNIRWATHSQQQLNKRSYTHAK